MDIAHFFDALARPPQDPASVHPVLSAAIHLAACRILGGRYSAFEPYFLEQARAYLSESLEHADRLTHFMWASVIMGSYLEMSCRLNESYVAISSVAQFALACGLDCTKLGESTRAAQYPILPPPATLDEATDHAHLAHAVYMVDRSLAVISGLPSVFASPAYRHAYGDSDAAKEIHVRMI